MIFAAVMVVLGTSMAQMADKMTAATPALANAAPRKGRRRRDRGASGRFAASASRATPAAISSTEVRIDGQRIGFMVDTGASLIALNESSAARFGLRPSPGDYNATVSTANGTIKAARTRLAMVELGGSWWRDVEAMCCRMKRCRKTCSACRFLSKLKRFEYANGQMVLEQ